MENFEVQESSEEGSITKEPIQDDDVDKLEISEIGSDQMRDSYGSLYSKDKDSCSQDSGQFLTRNKEAQKDLKLVIKKIGNFEENQ